MCNRGGDGSAPPSVAAGRRASAAKLAVPRFCKLSRARASEALAIRVSSCWAGARIATSAALPLPSALTGVEVEYGFTGGSRWASHPRPRSVGADARVDDAPAARSHRRLQRGRAVGIPIGLILRTALGRPLRVRALSPARVGRAVGAAGDSTAVSVVGCHRAAGAAALAASGASGEAGGGGGRSSSRRAKPGDG